MSSKRTLICFILIILSSWGFSQADRFQQHSVEISPSFNLHEELMVDFSYNFAKHRYALSFGSCFPLLGNSSSLFGIDIGIKYFPNPKKQTFDLFFHYYGEGLIRKLHKNSETKGIVFHNFIGYGFYVYPVDNLYIVHKLGVGPEFQWYSGFNTITDINAIFSIGIGFILHKKSNPEVIK